MNTLNSLFFLCIFIVVFSYGVGLMAGGPAKANKVLKWELNQAAKFLRWTLKHLFLAMGDIFHGLAKTCAPKKKTQKTP